MEEQVTESKDYINLFTALLGEKESSISSVNIDVYIKNNPNNIAFYSEIYNKETLVWTGELDITLIEDKIKFISVKLNTLLTVINKKENKVILTFNKGKTILGLDYKFKIKRLKNKLFFV